MGFVTSDCRAETSASRKTLSARFDATQTSHKHKTYDQMGIMTTERVSISETRPRNEAYFCPEASSQERWIALLLSVASCLYLRLFYDYTTLHTDEGIVLQGAQRILQGQVLYRDFFSFYTPGSYYWTALLLRLFGNSILVARAALVIYGGVFSTLTYLTARRVCFRSSAL